MAQAPASVPTLGQLADPDASAHDQDSVSRFYTAPSPVAKMMTLSSPRLLVLGSRRTIFLMLVVVGVVRW